MHGSGTFSGKRRFRNPGQKKKSHEPDVLNASEAAAFLGSHVETVRRLARRGEIPSFKLGKDWRFRTEALLRWTEEKESRGVSKTVLIVDDESQVCRILCKQVEFYGCRALSATSGSEGLDMVSQKPPDLVLLDLMMPELDGPEFLRELRTMHPDLPVVIVTGYPDSELMHRAMQFGPLMVLSKPVRSTQLERTISMALGGKVGQKVEEAYGE